jgi:uncharacterized protein (DUF3820 family)
VATDDLVYQPELLLELAQQRMPFGKYKGWLLIDLPEPYLAWFARQGFPRGKLGMLLSSAFEVKTNGLTDLVRPLAGARSPSAR